MQMVSIGKQKKIKKKVSVCHLLSLPREFNSFTATGDNNRLLQTA